MKGLLKYLNSKQDYLYVKENYAKIYRLGFTVEEVENILQGAK